MSATGGAGAEGARGSARAGLSAFAAMGVDASSLSIELCSGCSAASQVQLCLIIALAVSWHFCVIVLARSAQELATLP